MIKSFNDDKPYDRFVKEQLAGDEMEAATSSEPIVATGFYRLGIWDDEPTDAVQSRYDGLDDIVATTGQVFLGLTVDYARCHDHKIDPIPQKDYYKLLAFSQHQPFPQRWADGRGSRRRHRFRATVVRAADHRTAQQRKQLQEQVEEWEPNFKQLLEGEPGRARRAAGRPARPDPQGGQRPRRGAIPAVHGAERKPAGAISRPTCRRLWP